MTTSTVPRTVLLLAAGALLATGCTDSGADPGPTDGPTGAATSPEPTPSDTPNPHGLDQQTATALVAARFEAVYGLPPAPPDQIDVEGAGDGIVAPGSPEADSVAAALNQAIETGAINRGDVLVETLATPESADEEATATLCMSQNIRTTHVETGQDTGDGPAPPDDWLRIQADYRRIDGTWLVAEVVAVEPANCVPPSIIASTDDAWETFGAARIEHERRGGGPDIGLMETVVTDRFAETLRGIGPFDPPDVDPPPYTSFEVTDATRTTAGGRACRDGELETVEWELVGDTWLIDFAGQEGEEARPCP